MTLFVLSYDGMAIFGEPNKRLLPNLDIKTIGLLLYWHYLLINQIVKRPMSHEAISAIKLLCNTCKNMKCEKYLQRSSATAMVRQEALAIWMI